ncbi:hypothetical protein BHE74_00029088 [Ensete ventricosum]|nr:hypothetical protein GW17_00033431 [Ensete ventricosum]RWW63709.1 hypothetical protein BHE74_00029088 [Ensete ventricosum]RZR93715.1 hypothetical protein BHM03_00022281 [Ensete ventricosum]
MRDGEEWSGAMLMAEADEWETLRHAVEAYTGLSPVTFFMVLAVAVDFYQAVSGFLEPQPQVPRDRGAGERKTVEPLSLVRATRGDHRGGAPCLRRLRPQVAAPHGHQRPALIESQISCADQFRSAKV